MAFKIVTLYHNRLYFGDSTLKRLKNNLWGKNDLWGSLSTGGDKLPQRSFLGRWGQTTPEVLYSITQMFN
jgi:hypothetical protein